MKVYTVAHLPDDLAQAWLRHLRDFDTAHPGCHFQVLADAPELTLAELVEILSLNRAFNVAKPVIKRGRR